ncbi:MAG: hypothetical protein P8M78_05030 [Myxococcota bacterium]|nr:hypothetical protein [Myxococcota bacterium]
MSENPQRPTVGRWHPLPGIAWWGGLSMILCLGVAAQAVADARFSGPTLSAQPAPGEIHDVLGVPSQKEAHSENGALSGAEQATEEAFQTTDNVDRFGTPESGLIGPFDPEALPGRLSDPALRDLWGQGADDELAGRFVESARVYELIAGQVPEESFTYWRIARNYWRAGESLPLEDKEERIQFFEQSEVWAGRGISIDPDCAACMLWKFVALGRQATTRGIMTAVRDAREMDRLLTRGIALQPAFNDGEGNSILGNLYYAGAVFYRIVPDWWWLRFFTGVRGDKEKSLSYARRAVEISSARVDYRVELGAVLLCLGTANKDSVRLSEGKAVLEQARVLDDFLGTDVVDKEHAATLIETPDLACGYSRDGFIDIESMKDEARNRR